VGGAAACGEHGGGEVVGAGVLRHRVWASQWQGALGQRQGLAERALGERGQVGGQTEPGAHEQRTDGGAA
jgi:hypothetical protein